MRKIYISLLLVTAAQFAFAQQYQCVYPNTTSMFSDGTELNAIRLDSVTNEAGCQVYWNYPVIRPASATQGDWCFSDHGGSWIGRKFRVYPNGDHVFYNIEGAPVLLKTIAHIDDSWICYQRSDLQIKATITDTGPETFLGLTDLVKTISLQALDATGNPIAHPINGKQFKISKNHGFVKVVPLYVFPDIQNFFIPDIVNEFSLTGLSSPAAGKQDLTVRDCYSFDLNDEIHTFYNLYSTYGQQKNIKSLRKLVAKSVSVNLDTLNLTWETCSRETRTIGITDTVILFSGNITEKVIFSALEQKTDKLPGEIISAGSLGLDNYNRSFNEMFGKPGKTLYYGFSSSPEDTCLHVMVVKKSPETTNMGYPGNSYVEGLGGGYFYWNNFYEESYQPVYWKKGSEEWGTPYSCGILLGVNDIENVPAVSIGPNPAREQVHIKLAAGKIRSLAVYDISGRKIMEKALNQSDYVLAVSTLEKGVYIVVINNQVRSRFIKQ